MSIVLLAILAVTWAALPLVAGARGRSGRPRRRAGHSRDDGWRPASVTRRDGSGRRETPRILAHRRAVRRRRQVLLALTIALVAAVRAWYLLGGRWWIAEAVCGALLLAYLVALVVLGRRGHRPARAPAGERPPRRPRRRAELPLWSTPLLEGQASSRPE